MWLTASGTNSNPGLNISFTVYELPVQTSNLFQIPQNLKLKLRSDVTHELARSRKSEEKQDLFWFLAKPFSYH